MYDSVGICLSTHVDVRDYLPHFEEKINHKTGEISFVGYVGNFRVKKTVEFVSLYGSLSKYYFGDNFSTLSVNETKEAIEKLSNNLNLDLKGARIYRLDFGTNLILDHPVPQYLSRFGLLKYHKKSMYNDYQTVEYRNSLHEISCYDKSQEHKNKKIPIPDALQGMHIAKIEERNKKRLAKRFQLPIITAATLCNKNFFNLLIDNLVNGYFSINKHRVIKPVGSIKLNNVPSVRNYLAVVGLKYANINILDILKTKEINKTPKSRIRAFIRELITDKDITKEDSLIIEFNQKIVEAVNKYRC
jgi:hypothetical protein